jgi:hypothetical protein
MQKMNQASELGSMGKSSEKGRVCDDLNLENRPKHRAADSRCNIIFECSPDFSTDSEDFGQADRVRLPVSLEEEGDLNNSL